MWILKRCLSLVRNFFRRLLFGRTDSQRHQLAIKRGQVAVGRGSYGSPKLIVFNSPGSILPHLVIGNYCSIAQDVTVIVNGGHRTEWVTTFPVRSVFGMEGAGHDGHPKQTGPVIIGNDVWIGHGALLLGGITIGDGAVIGAGSVVRKDVRPYAIVIGNPSYEVGRRFDNTTVDRLLEIGWWDLEEAQVKTLAKVLCDTPNLEYLEMRVKSLKQDSQSEA